MTSRALITPIYMGLKDLFQFGQVGARAPRCLRGGVSEGLVEGVYLYRCEGSVGVGPVSIPLGGEVNL